MFVILKKWAKSGLYAFGLVFAVEGSLVASAGESERNNCNDFGECYRTVGGSAEILKWCEAASATIAWNHRKKGASLVSCDCECTSHQGSIFESQLPYIASNDRQSLANYIMKTPSLKRHESGRRRAIYLIGKDN